jgi:hypothetical protein
LTGDVREKRKEYARAILPFLHAAERDGWHHPVIGDDSWFFYNISSRRMWTLSRNDVITKPRHDIQRKSFIHSIIWNPSGFSALDRLPNHSKMKSAYFLTNMLIPIDKRSFLEEGHCMKDDLWSISTVALFAQVGFEQFGLKNTIFSACHANCIHLIWPLVTSTCFRQSKKSSHGFSWLTSPVF